MKYLFSHEGEPALQQLGTAPNVLVALDFDGTLAPIVNQPSQARMPLSIAEELDRLCTVARVAIISGRNLRDLAERVPAKVSWLVGNHGNEGLAEILIERDACSAICAAWAEQLQGMAESHIEGIAIEQKGYTLAVHYRHAKYHLAAQETLSRRFARLVPAPRVVHGKCVFDLIPPGAISKDEAMKVLVRQTRPDTVLYVGDDECDELVFDNAQPDWITIRVGYWRHSGAKYYLRYQREVRDLLMFVNLRLGASSAC